MALTDADGRPGLSEEKSDHTNNKPRNSLPKGVEESHELSNRGAVAIISEDGVLDIEWRSCSWQKVAF